MTDIAARDGARVQTPWLPWEIKRLQELWVQEGGKMARIAKIMGRTKGSIDGKSRVLGLQFHADGEGKPLEPDHPAVISGRSLYPSRVVAPGAGLLKSGDNQRKLGRMVHKGPWKGMPIYSLTLQERATCPTSCKMWRSCYGNAMGHAKRYQHGDALIDALVGDLWKLSKDYPRGYVVRLHLLGDFFSPEYVDFWSWMLDLHPALHIFGYSAWDIRSPIGMRIDHLRRRKWDRFAVRTSGDANRERSMRALVVNDIQDAPPNAIFCPAQSGRTKTCGTCALCWSSTAKNRPIVFLAH